MTGASVGSALDEMDDRNAERVRQAVYAQQAGGLSSDEIIAMANAGLHDDIIVRHIQSHGFQHPLDASDLIYLRRQGVTDRVIAALQEEAARPIGLASSQIPAATPPVVIEEHAHYVPYPYPYPYPRPWRYRHPLHGPPGPQFHWGFTVGH